MVALYLSSSTSWPQGLARLAMGVTRRQPVDGEQPGDPGRRDALAVEPTDACCLTDLPSVGRSNGRTIQR